MSFDSTRIRPAPGSAAEVGENVAPGPALRIGDVELGAQLGRGGMAAVYEGLDFGFDPPRRVAVKLMDPALGEEPEFRQRFRQEAHLVANFRNDNIVHVYSSGEMSDGALYIVMEYLPGGSLAQRLESGPLALDETLEIAAAMANALEYSHSNDVIHRDFKPGNILFAAGGKPVLSDFGVAKRNTTEEAGLTRHAMSIGAPRYMAPEQERAENVTDRADIYALGLTVVEMLTGRSLPARLRTLRDRAQIEELRQILPARTPGSLVELLRLCLQFDPGERPAAAELRERLHAELGETRQRRVSSWPRNTGRSRLPTGTLWVVASALLALLLIGTYVFLGERTADDVASGKGRARPMPAESTGTVKLQLPSRTQFDLFLRLSEDDHPLLESDVASVQEPTLQEALRYKWLLKSGSGDQASALKRRVDELSAHGDPRAAVTALLIDSFAAGGLKKSQITPQLQAASQQGDAMASFFWAGALGSELEAGLAQDEPAYLEYCKLLRLTRDQGWTDVAAEAMSASECPLR